MTTVYVYDFDGTLTRRDTLLLFIAYARGWHGLLLSLFLFAPFVLLMKLHLLDNGRVKQRLFAWHFKGTEEAEFNDCCLRFAQANGHIVCREPQSPAVIVTASIDRWVQPFFPDAEVIGTQIEVYDGRLTGRFATPNCYGAEKVRRLREAHPECDGWHIVAYGDSRGDREMLLMADEAHWV